jgi:cytochrome c5
MKTRGASSRRRPAVAAACLAAVAAAAALAQQSDYPELGDEALRRGRAVWLNTCATCHTDDFTGAPLVTDKAAWTPRLGKGRDALYVSALNGMFGPMGTEMPPRGDNPKLSDEEVTAAVDYMVALVEYLDNSTKEKGDDK